MKGYTGILQNKSEIYIPTWPVDAALENLAQASKYLGSEELLAISEKNIPAFMMALTKTSEPAKATALIKHFVCSARVDGDKIHGANYDTLFEGDLHFLADVFVTVVHSQYHDFFLKGLAKVNSQDS
jgi:hypothetical protein